MFTGTQLFEALNGAFRPATHAAAWETLVAAAAKLIVRPKADNVVPTLVHWSGYKEYVGEEEPFYSPCAGTLGMMGELLLSEDVPAAKQEMRRGDGTVICVTTSVEAWRVEQGQAQIIYFFCVETRLEQRTEGENVWTKKYVVCRNLHPVDQRQIHRYNQQQGAH